MIYEAYEKKVRGYLPLARILKICVKCAVLLLILGAVLLLGYLSLRGIHFGTYTLQSETVAFGDKPEYDCFVLLGTYKCEYARAGSENWSAEQPTTPGTYSVRAVITKGLLGKKIYSEVGTVTMYRREITLRPQSKGGTKVEYGEQPVFGKHWQISDSLLAKGHSVESAKLTYFTYDGRGGAICHIDPSSIVIRDKKGNDVTAGYKLSFTQGTIKVKAKQITVVVADEIKNGKPLNITKTYDGKSASTANFEMTKGTLYSGDKILVTPHSVSADVGRHDNRVTVTVINDAGQDRTAYYNIKVDVCKVVIEKRPITVQTPDVTLEYTGMRQYTDKFTVTSGSIVQGQYAEPVHNDKTGVTEITNRPQDNRVQLRITQSGRDVTKNYDITYEYGSLTVKPRKVHLRSGDSYGLVYNGKEQSWQDYRVYSGTLAPGHSVKIKKAASLKTPGSIENEVDFAIVSWDGKDVTKNYDMTVSYGTLTVEKGAYLQLSYKDLRKIYDATPLSPSKYGAMELVGITGGALFEDDYIQIESTSGSLTDAGTGTYTVQYRIMHKEGLGKAIDATDWYASSLVGQGSLTVDKRALEIRFDPKTKRYDGTPLYAPTPVYLNSTNEWIHKYEDKGHKIVLNGSFYDYVTYQKNGYPVSAPVETGTYTYTVPEELFKVVLDDGSGADRTHNYDFYFTGNTIKIEGIGLTLTAPGGSKQYDGMPLSADDFSTSDVRVSWSSGAGQYTASYTLSGSQTNVGTGSLNVQNVQVWDRQGNNVTANFEIKTVAGKLTVTPISISVKTSSGSKVYDGQPMDNATQMTLTSGKLVAGHVLGGSVKSDYVADVGTHDNDRVTPKVYSATGQDMTGNYLITINPGRYTVKPATLHIGTPLVQGEYSAKPYNGICDATSSARGLVKGQRVELNVVSDGIELGVHPMHVTGYKVLDARGRDATANYEITYEDGQIEIVPRKITVITGSSVVTHQEAPAKSSEIRVGGSGLVDGHEIRATFTYPRGIYDIGQTETNSLETLRIVDEDGRDVTAYYDIRTSYGMLRVKPIEITITTADAYRDVYNGQPLSMPHYVITKGECLTGHSLHVSFKYQNDGPADVGKWKNELSSIRMTDEHGNDVTYMYEFTVNEGILEIANPYVLPMQSFDAEKMYDGTPLISEQYELLGELLPGHAIAGVTPVSIDLVGEIENRLGLIIMDEMGRDVSQNYAFYYDESTLGTLRITHRPMQIVIDPHVVLTYNGTAKLPIPQDQMTPEGLVAGQKVMLPMQVESPEIGEKYDYAFGDAHIYDARGRDVTHCYYFELSPAYADLLQSVTVQPAELELYMPDRYSKEYDGTGVDPEQAGYRPMGLAAGHSVEYVANTTPAEPGSYMLRMSEWVVYDQMGNDVTANYVITSSTCRVTINPLYLKLTSVDASRHYNGLPLTREELKQYKLPKGYTLEVIFTGSQTEVGKSENTFDVVVYDQNGNDITAYCNIAKTYGTLEVWDQIKLTLRSESDMMIYDGTPLVCHELGKYQLPEGYSMEVFFTGEQTEPGISDNLFYVVIYDQSGEVVTDSFDIKYEYGKLHVVRAEDWVITLISKDATKNYDGTPLWCFELEPYDLPRGFYLDVTFTGEQTEIGESANTFTARVYNDAGQELTVQYEYGTLAVHLDITVNAYEMTYTYDGTEKNCEDVWVQGLPEGYRVEVKFGKGLIVTGTKDVEFRSVTVYDAQGNDVTSLCNLTLNTAKLTVLPRILTVYVYGQSADSIAPVQGELVEGHTLFAEYGEGGECYIEIADASGELVYSNRGDSPVRYTLYEVIIQYG